MDQSLFPAHAGSMTLTHNEHKDLHITVAEWVEQQGFDDMDWVSNEQKRKAIQVGDVWVLEWSPDTPVGHCTLMAADLDTLLQAARSSEKQ